MDERIPNIPLIPRVKLYTNISESNNNDESETSRTDQQSSSSKLIEPKKLINPCQESRKHQDLHRELLFNQKIGKNVLNQKSELQKVFDDRKKKHVINETPSEFQRVLNERQQRFLTKTIEDQ